ncbi:MAG: PilZ domain-containing protein [Aquabacterium sp.]
MTVQGSTHDASEDARHSPRVTVAWRARVITGPQSYEDVRVVNISDDGLGFMCNLALAAGNVLMMAMAIPDPRDRSQFCYVTLQVKVVHHIISGSKFRIGTRLVQADDTARRLIAHWYSKG